MKNVKQIQRSLLLVLLAILSYSTIVHAQCYDTLGSSPNILSTALNRANQVIVNNELNTVIFIHRNDISLFGGDNGVYKYDISTDNGATWQLNHGNLNPGSTNGTNGARYPQVGIYNPAGNTDVTGASLVYHGPTNAGTDWNGYVTGSLLLDGAATSTENYNQAGVSNILIPGGFCQGAPGTFWTLDAISDDDFTATGFRVLKGTYAAGDVVWSVNAEFFPDFNTDLYGYGIVADWNIAFDPSGQYGWIVAFTHLNGLPGYSQYPVFYKTVDGGATWSGPEQLDPASFSSITSVEANPACSFESDLAVDVNGNPHALIAVFQDGGDYTINPNVAGHLFDFTYNGSSWNAVNVATTSWLRVFGDLTQTDSRPQISRSDDGSKLVFTWVASDLPSSTGLQTPNLKAVTYDVATGNLSCPYDYARICPDVAGAMYQTSVSPNLIEEGGVYTVPVVITTVNASGSQNDPAQHYYLNALSFTAAQFSAANSPTYPTITTNGPVEFCGAGSVELTASTSSTYLWNTGETTQTITAIGGVYWVVNPDDNYCVGTSNSVSVVAIFPPDIFAFTTPVICDGGGSVDLYANYYSVGGDIQWSNGDTVQLITVTSPGVYSVTVDGCASPYSVEVTTGSAPANDNICNAEPLTVGTPTQFTNICATAEANEPTPPVDPFFDPNSQTGWFDETGEPAVVLSNTVWFTFIAPASGAVNISTEGFDSQLALWSSSDNSCTGTFTLIAANDDGNFFFGSFIRRASCLEAGKQYFVQVDGLYGQTGYATITVTDAGAITELTLVDADTDTDLGPLFENATNVIDLAIYPHINIRAETCQGGVTGSVEFHLNGVVERIENVAPFAVAGDNPTGNYKAWNITPGEHYLIAFAQPSAGDPAIPYAINLTVINTADCDPYLQVVNTAKSWRKLKLGNNPNSLWTPVDVTDGGNNTTLCVTLRDPNGNVDWNRILVRAGGAGVAIGNYGTPGTSFTQVCIPLADFAGADFSALNLMEIPYSNGHDAFEIHVKRVEFTGDANPYVWFGAPKTDNANDGQAGGGSALFAELVTPICGGAKQSAETAVKELVTDLSPAIMVDAYPNPFGDKVFIEFVLRDDSPISLELYSVTGQKLATAFEGTANGGQLYRQELNTSMLPSGFYLYKLQTKDEVKTEKILLSR